MDTIIITHDEPWNKGKLRVKKATSTQRRSGNSREAATCR